ncbi:hypothetical protein [Chryseobacterium foetidum]|uniref:hypothetical protein n=1 Tax=Chryseobacterium foetidum TaxID=2951057 RepID=UPI0021C866D3|nr:hypothetical protein [Chryseobacterium foetidum]
MNPETKNKLLNVIPLIIIAFIIYRFSNSSVFDTMISDGNNEIKEFVKKSFSWGICFGALIVIFIKYFNQLIKKN